ncbi:hypothetical protein LTR94_024693, partial [Friedmanniomyces endolithicus]
TKVASERILKAIRRICDTAVRLRDDRAGNVAMIFGLSLPILVMFVLGGIDLQRVVTGRSQFQDALDAATLAAARSSYTEPADLKAITLTTLRANLEDSVVEPIADADVTVSLTRNNVVISDAAGKVKTLVANIVLPPYGKLLDDTLPINVHSEVNRSAKNLEVAMVLDVTGSMSGSDIANLQSAATKMVDIVVKDQQTPYSSRMSIVPYSMGVNLGSRAAAARGAITPGTSISNINRSCSTSWSTTTCTFVVTSAGHGLTVGSRVVINGVVGVGVNSATNTAYTVTARTANTFTFSVNQSISGSYNRGGTAYCTTVGCQYLAFTNADGGTSVQQISTCVTERTGSDAYTDASPSSSEVGLNYPMNESSNACLDSQVQPLTSDRSTLKSIISDLSAVGSTAGHIGTAWGWYTVAPNFNSLWPTASAANPYDAQKTIKSVVLMTDGDFNTPYNSGVIARDALTGSGANSNKINLNATNGASAAQAQRLCTAMKAKGVTVYTVGFSIASNSAAATLLSNCASSSDKAYLANSGAALIAAFEAIGRDITKLRITK